MVAFLAWVICLAQRVAQSRQRCAHLWGCPPVPEVTALSANLSFGTTADDLVQLFGQYGAVERAQVVSDRETCRSRGFGFVEISRVVTQPSPRSTAPSTTAAP
jgi:hypothetical protein